MAFKISKREWAGLQEQAQEVVDAKNSYLDSKFVEIENLHNELVEAIQSYNEELDNTKTELEAIVTDWRNWKDGLQEAYEEKSERWQEGEKGRAVGEWLDNMEDSVSSSENAYEFEEMAEPDAPESSHDSLEDWVTNYLPEEQQLEPEY